MNKNMAAHVWPVAAS